MEKQYFLEGVSVRVKIREGLVCIFNDQALKQAIAIHPEALTRALVKQIKTDYKARYGRDLAIPDDSFTVEIWGHLYADYFLLKYSGLMKSILPFGLYNRLRRSCEVIDCGEHGKDPNRWLWNTAAPCRRVLAKLLANARLSRSGQSRP